MKVRYTSRCAGGCGRFLVVGTYAERRHRTLWCGSCYATHTARCTRCDEQDARPLVSAGEPGLW